MVLAVRFPVLSMTVYLKAPDSNAVVALSWRLLQRSSTVAVLPAAVKRPCGAVIVAAVASLLAYVGLAL